MLRNCLRDLVLLRLPLGMCVVNGCSSTHRSRVIKVFCTCRYGGGSSFGGRDYRQQGGRGGGRGGGHQGSAFAGHMNAMPWQGGYQQQYGGGGGGYGGAYGASYGGNFSQPAQQTDWWGSN